MNPRDVGCDYDLAAPGFDERFSANPRTVARYRRLEAPMLAVARGRVLDLGCGSGRLLGALGGVGVDLSASLLRVAREKGLAVARADAHALPFAAERFT